MNSPEKGGKAPYPYKNVFFWIFIVFLIGFGGAAVPEGVHGGAAMGVRIAIGIVLIIIVGPIIGIYKYFHR